ncbi:MAG: type I DNA topoisomerase [Ruminococcus sp.]|jgi:DNA topoisomerase-1|nr:type I DNA topoisomerase [Ruminococcus sp.]
MSNLVIVESPAKAKTIGKYLGKDYDVIASMGHVRDLLKSKMGIDFENGFTPSYTEMKGKEDIIKKLKTAAKKADYVYLATDPDREGEAISWHLAQILGLSLSEKNRVTFNEITKSGIDAGMKGKRKIDMELVNAQQARRLLDRIVGYNLSPFLWRKVKRGLSAGRVQSVAVSLIVDRENEIKAFSPEEYWSIDGIALAPPSRKQFEISYYGVEGKKKELKNQKQADDIMKRTDGADFTVKTIKKSVRKKSPAPPFTTSTLQQEASKKLGFAASRTMKAAQTLYEGVDVDVLGTLGLITYMRTDSLRIADEAKATAAETIKKIYGKEYVPEKYNEYKSKKAAQDAHEAIRPSIPSITPESVKSSLNSDQYKLYKLIWERFIASQMTSCTLDMVSADINANGVSFRATGFTVRFAGYTVLYQESKDEDESKSLPELHEGDKLKIKSLEKKQHFTSPPPRYTEASLIKAMEENGIGRPSTYAPTISTIINRYYVEREGKALKPTPLGEVTTELMKDHFKNIVDTRFTAGMEEELDEIEEGKKNWQDTLRDFYNGFESELQEAETAMEGKRMRVPSEETNEVCEVCGKPMVIKIGRFGKFLACSGFPECTNTKRIAVDTGGICPKCGARILAKKSQKGKKYYGCEMNPQCDFMTWDQPISDKCPKCNDGTTLFRKGSKVYCVKCDYTDSYKKL